ncbi:TadE/TadG family type IV pilus assembly protein [Streptomyces sp. NPDC005318]|uniref:TadE/TadG family type IV pilus assembly protein n=1 Tax=Streptomyces sp. NPDC005318 TaxID=3157031 RepID=UPI0033AD901F
MATTEMNGPEIREIRGRRDGGPSDPSRGRDRGQTAIEFVGVTPLIILLLIALWQCALIGYTFSLAGNAADEAARAGTGAGYLPELACQRAAREDLPDAWRDSSETTCDAGPALYKARVTLHVPILVPGVLNWPMQVDGEAASPTEG